MCAHQIMKTELSKIAGNSVNDWRHIVVDHAEKGTRTPSGKLCNTCNFKDHISSAKDDDGVYLYFLNNRTPVYIGLGKLRSRILCHWREAQWVNTLGHKYEELFKTKYELIKTGICCNNKGDVKGINCSHNQVRFFSNPALLTKFDVYYMYTTDKREIDLRKTFKTIYCPLYLSLKNMIDNKKGFDEELQIHINC